jgi:hypothetical protein
MFPMTVGNLIQMAIAQFTRPADTTAYASGDLVANSTTAGSVVPMTFNTARDTGAGGVISRVRLRKSGTSITSASFRLHLYNVSPTVSNGDNGAWLTTGAGTYIGSFDITMDKAFSDGAVGVGIPTVGTDIRFRLRSGSTHYGVLEARAAYTPANAEVFTVELEVVQS